MYQISRNQNDDSYKKYHDLYSREKSSFIFNSFNLSNQYFLDMHDTKTWFQMFHIQHA